jgi:ATP-dependent Clp protease ATP-binding subunit ClpA
MQRVQKKEELRLLLFRLSSGRVLTNRRTIERFSEAARRSLFSALYEAACRGGGPITEDHLLQGILSGAPNAVPRLGALVISQPHERRAVIVPVVLDETLAGFIENRVPLTAGARTVLERAAREADDLGKDVIEPKHLILALLQQEGSQAFRTLQAAGVELQDARRIVSGPQEEGGG